MNCQIYSLLTCIKKEHLKCVILKNLKKTTHSTFQFIFHACSPLYLVPPVHTGQELSVAVGVGDIAGGHRNESCGFSC